jgi:periplasmic protein CpxP/Spy
MKASLLARVAPALVLSSVLAGGLAVCSHAQTIAPQSGSMTQSQGGAVPATGSAAATPGGASTLQTGAAAPQTGTAAPQMGTATPETGTTMAPQGNAPTTARAAPSRTMVQMVEQRITDLHSRLDITHAQQSKWNRFAAVMRSNAQQLDAAYQRRAEQLDSMSALENMQSYAQIERRRVSDVERLVPAFRALYASLSPQQKRMADELFRDQAQQAQQHRQASIK